MRSGLPAMVAEPAYPTRSGRVAVNNSIARLACPWISPIAITVRRVKCVASCMVMLSKSGIRGANRSGSDSESNTSSTVRRTLNAPEWVIVRIPCDQPSYCPRRIVTGTGLGITFLLPVIRVRYSERGLQCNQHHYRQPLAYDFHERIFGHAAGIPCRSWTLRFGHHGRYRQDCRRRGTWHDGKFLLFGVAAP